MESSIQATLSPSEHAMHSDMPLLYTRKGDRIMVMSHHNRTLLLANKNKNMLTVAENTKAAPLSNIRCEYARSLARTPVFQSFLFLFLFFYSVPFSVLCCSTLSLTHSR
ncbi:hypothetical protein GQ42DRAFT_162017 [Ramicandelaber brevisporus]|nr:hypothetical protein GQ42DRAFT_162017 [Ramicandelaber brevisporus]